MYSWTLLMVYSKAKLKSYDDKASPLFQAILNGKLVTHILHNILIQIDKVHTITLYFCKIHFIALVR
jgi:hypothetical protein